MQALKTALNKDTFLGLTKLEEKFPVLYSNRSKYKQ